LKSLSRSVVRPLLACLFAVLLAFPSPAFGKPSSGHPKSASSAPKTVHVKGYTKKDGTYVQGYDRKAPESQGSKTGEFGTKTEKSTVTSSYTGTSARRDSNGRIVRSEEAKHAFEAQTGFPHGRSGYVVDHIKPLACGGADEPSNMQWQTAAEAKAKDKWERKGCR